MLNTPIQMLLVMLAGWVNEEQRSVTDQIASVVRAPPHRHDLRVRIDPGSILRRSAC